MFFLNQEIRFPPVSATTIDGIIAIGGDLSSKRLIHAYENGIFPWFEENSAIVWWCPDPRMVLFPDNLRVTKSMNQILKSNRFKVTFNMAFNDVIYNCSKIKREGQNGTWITNDMVDAYILLHEKGVAKSVEVWEDDILVGGLYGVDLKDVFCGESMFAKTSNASKVALIKLVGKLKKENYKLIDCQVYTDHLASLGAEEIPRDQFLSILKGH